MRERMERFAKYMQLKGLNDNQVTNACGLSKGLLGQARKGKSDLGGRAVDAILNKYQDLNRVWLLTGDGDMLTDIDVQNISVAPEASSHFKQVKLCHVPLLNLDVRGGYDGNDVDDPQYIRRMVPWLGALPTDFAAEVSGNSMAPTIPTGSLLLLRQVEGWRTFLELNQLYVFELQDYRRLLKKAMASDKGPDYIRLVSYNPETPPQDLPLNFVIRVYKVVSQATRFGF